MSTKIPTACPSENRETSKCNNIFQQEIGDHISHMPTVYKPWTHGKQCKGRVRGWYLITDADASSFSCTAVVHFVPANSINILKLTRHAPHAEPQHLSSGPDQDEVQLNCGENNAMSES